MGDRAGALGHSWVEEPLRSGDMTRCAWVGLFGEICHCTAGGGVPHELLELVRRRWPGGGGPMVNWTVGGDIWSRFYELDSARI
jgi:hypothetical protein